ncbi:uncharacterized protein LOC103885959 [Papio anubis]|uniref:uncharacterized protein LOC103885959 n=1 Tax=Papio anubis TaxID=9555 RepID=UPI0012AD909F|nr:uncharacterized protein LOC103885959 [Papio anubis]
MEGFLEEVIQPRVLKIPREEPQSRALSLNRRTPTVGPEAWPLSAPWIAWSRQLPTVLLLDSPPAPRAGLHGGGQGVARTAPAAPPPRTVPARRCPLPGAPGARPELAAAEPRRAEGAAGPGAAGPLAAHCALEPWAPRAAGGTRCNAENCGSAGSPSRHLGPGSGWERGRGPARQGAGAGPPAGSPRGEAGHLRPAGPGGAQGGAPKAPAGVAGDLCERPRRASWECGAGCVRPGVRVCERWAVGARGRDSAGIAAWRGGRSGARRGAGTLPCTRTSTRCAFSRAHTRPPCRARRRGHHLGAEPCGAETGAGAGTGGSRAGGCRPGAEPRADCAPKTGSYDHDLATLSLRGYTAFSLHLQGSDSIQLLDQLPSLLLTTVWAKGTPQALGPSGTQQQSGACWDRDGQAAAPQAPRGQSVCLPTPSDPGRGERGRLTLPPASVLGGRLWG